MVTTEFYPAAEPRPRELADASLVIGTVCVLRPEKALPLLQEAFARVRHLKPKMKLLLVGSGAELENLRSNAAQLDIAQDSVFIPATRDVAKWMRALDIYVLPSKSEAFSNSLLEAMACGCPVIGSRVGGTPEMIGTDGTRGLLFESGNAADLAARFEQLIVNDEYRKRLGALAAEFVRHNLTIEIAAERTGAMYERLLEGKTRRHPAAA